MRTFLDGRVALYPGDCLAVLSTLPEASVDSVVTDPPYGLEFMGKEWDSFGKAPTGGAAFTPDGMGKGFKALPSFTGSPNPSCASCGGSQRGNDRKGFTRCRCESPSFPNTKLKQMRAFQAWCEVWAREASRVLKPGGHLVAFSGTRTYHRMVCAIEDAGFEVRDQIGWAFGSGFPKSHNVGDGWGTALKPAWEPIVLARKPLVGTVAENVLRYGTGALNIDGCRVATNGEHITAGHADSLRRGNYQEHEGWDRPWKQGEAGREDYAQRREAALERANTLGRWPANLITDGSEEVLAAFPVEAGAFAPVTGREPSATTNGVYGKWKRRAVNDRREGEASASRRYIEEGATNFAALPGVRREAAGSAARFFYTAKADAEDRLGSKHPTVKPLDLMQWLVRLVTPRGGTVLDCFAGTGTTGEAAWREGMRAILIEREEEYIADIERRMDLAAKPTKRAAVAKTKNNLTTATDLPLFQSQPL